MTVRLAAPDGLFTFNLEKEVNRMAAGNKIFW